MCGTRLKESTRENQPPTLVSLLLSETPPLGDLGATDMWDQVVSLLFAGHETAASAIAWTLYWLERHDDVRHAILDELAATSDSGADAARVPLLDAACRESLRLSPPAIVAGHRVLSEDLELLGETQSAGSVLTPCIYLAHRNPEFYPDPSSFEPHRFLETQFSAQHYFPFGGGIRRCLGADLAILEMRMIIAMMLRRRTLHCVNPNAGVPRLRATAMSPSPTLQMRVTACHF